VGTPEATQITAALLERFPDRFLFGTDEVAPADSSQYTRVYHQYQPLWDMLDPVTSKKVRLANYERIFDEARRNVRHWESTHISIANGDR
jgi:hypothetical protein